MDSQSCSSMVSTSVPASRFWPWLPALTLLRGEVWDGNDPFLLWVTLVMVFITALDLVVSSPLPFESLWLSAMDGLCWRRVRSAVIWVYVTVCWLQGQNSKYRFHYGIFSATLSFLPSPIILDPSCWPFFCPQKPLCCLHVKCVFLPFCSSVPLP